MTTLGNKRDASPIVIRPGGALSRPTRVPFTERKLREGLLHRLIESNPDILPISEIEPAFSPSITVGYEVATHSGPIDVLLLSGQGYLTIVETKLWRNPEARREVVGQIVDYAKDVSQWSFEDLEGKVRDYNLSRHKRNDGIIASLRKLQEIDESQEAIITDTVTRNLRNGRFLLLVVGDGIRESVEAMADYLQQTPQLHFTLALVELQIYELDDGGKGSQLIIPQVVARTREITRAVVRVEGKGIIVENGTPPVKDKLKDKLTSLSEDDFNNILKPLVSNEDYEFAIQLREDMKGLGNIIAYRQISFVVILPDPGGSGEKLKLLKVATNGHVEPTGDLSDKLRDIGLQDQIAYDYAKESAQLFGIGVKGNKPGSWSRSITLGEMRQQYQKFVPIIRKTVDRIKQASKKQA
ncbi:MAG: hypothetical protein MUO80_04355 [Dehalococcoidia bacterium]|nr:hypothetical protein [Dehalococcoidia bacterium]